MMLDVMWLPGWTRRRRCLRLEVLRRAMLFLTLLQTARAAPDDFATCSDIFVQQDASAGVAIAADCYWEGLPAVSTLTGQKQEANGIAGPPALISRPAKGVEVTAAGPSSITATYVVLVGFQLPDPNQSSMAFVPTGLAATADASVVLQDVRILVDSNTLQQHLQYIARQTNVTHYTDQSTFLHINYFANSRASWQSVGLLLATDLQDARSTSSPVAFVSSFTSNNRGLLQDYSRSLAAAAAAGNVAVGGKLPPPKYGYVLAATNDTLVQLMTQIGAVAGPVGAVIYIDTNITLSKPPFPDEGILVARPLYVVGLVLANTSLDLHMKVNQIILNETWSNITFDRVAIENMAPGDARSAEVARPLSVSSANNFWSLYYPREEDRLSIINCTMVLGGQEELDYYLYWATVYHSSLPYFKQLAKFIRDVIRITVWELGDSGQPETSVLIRLSVAGSCTVQDTLYTVNPVVAPKLQRPPLDPSLQLNSAEKSPLVTAVDDVTSLREQLNPLGPSEEGRTHVVLLRDNISLPESATGSNTGLGAGAPPQGMPVPHPLSILGDFSKQESSVLNLGFARNLLALPPGAQENQLQVQHIVLKGLAQGPAASTAAGLWSPDVWTILGWAFRRSSDKSVSLSACTMELPPQEFDALKQQVLTVGGQIILKLAGDVQTDGDGLFLIKDVSIDSTSANIMQVGSFEGHGLSGSNITLQSSSAAAALPGGYFWPGGSLPTLATSEWKIHLNQGTLAAAIAVPIVVGVAVLAGLAALLLIRRRRRRQQQQHDVEKAHVGLYGDQMLPKSAGSNDDTGGRFSSSSGADVCSSKCTTLEGKVSTSASPAALTGSVVGHRSTNSGNKLVAWQASEAAAQDQAAAAAAAAPDGCLDQMQQMAGAEAFLGAGGGILSSTQQQQLWSLAKQMDQMEQHQQQPEGLGLIQVLGPHGPVGQGYISHPAVPVAQQGPGVGFDQQQQVHAAAAAADATSMSKSGVGRGTTDSAKSITEWQTPQQSAARMSQQQQQQQSGTLFHSVNSSTLSAAAKQLQQKAKEQGLVDAAQAPVKQLPSNPGQELQQQEQQQQSSNAGLAAAQSSAGASKAKPWQRVSSAISLLQQGITQRRLEAAYAEAARPASTSAAGAVRVSSPAASGSDPALAAAAAAAESSESGQGSSQATGGLNAAQRSGSLPQLQMLDMIGRGTFACVYRAIWRGRCVAVKVVHLPADIMEGASDIAAALQTRERMAIMEAVVSITMSHPNIVQVYTFALKPLPPPLHVGGALTASAAARQQQQPADGASGWELQLVMEYCAEGSLRQALNQQRLVEPSTSTLPALPMVLALAHDVACAMLHLHSEDLIHGDLKASNVLLTHCNAPLISHGSMGGSTGFIPPGLHTGDAASVAGSSTGSGRLTCAALLAAQQAAQGGRLVAKIADFGLSLSLAPGDTHVSHMHAGTLTHMAPELLLHGRASKPSDVYAFGILLWELATGCRAFQGVPVALLGHNVAHLRWRPGWLPEVPAPLRALVEQCWAQEAIARPPFEDILSRLEQLMQLSPDELKNPGLVGARAGRDHQQQQQQPGAAGGSPRGLAPSANPSAVIPAGQSCIAAAGNEAVVDKHGWTGDWSLPKHQQQQQQPVLKQCAAADNGGVPVDGPAAVAPAPAGNDSHGHECTGDWTLPQKRQ